MIDFKTSDFFNLKPVYNGTYAHLVTPMFVSGEDILSTFQTVRDGIIFTNKRIIVINVKGITGKKKDFTSLPYSKIQAYSVETAGTFDLDSELELWFAGLGLVHLEFTAGANVSEICRIISEHVL